MDILIKNFLVVDEDKIYDRFDFHRIRTFFNIQTPQLES